jgi:hypothetical protein
MIKYATRSAQGGQVSLAVQVYGSFLIHAGPQGCWDPSWGSNGCVELFGPWEHDRFLKIVGDYSEAQEYPGGKRDPLYPALPIWAKYEPYARPSIGGEITQLAKYEYDKYQSERVDKLKAIGGANNPDVWFPDHVYKY